VIYAMDVDPFDPAPGIRLRQNEFLVPKHIVIDNDDESDR
jgi:hypothetical protein